MPIAYIAILFHWHIDTSLLFYLVQHLQCRLDSSLRLVCIKTTCFKVHSCIIPTNDSLHKGIGPSAGWYRNGIISQHRERTAQIGIYLPQGTNESIVLSITGSRLLVGFAVNLYLQGGNRFQSLCQRQRIVQNTDALVRHRIVMEHIADDIRKVLRRNHFFYHPVR